MSLLLAGTMNVNGFFKSGDVDVTGGYSFKSLLLGGEGLDEAVDKVGAELSLFRDEAGNGESTFKSLLLDAAVMDEETQSSLRNDKHGNADYPSCELVSSSATSATLLEGNKFQTLLKNGNGVETLKKIRDDEMSSPPTKKRRAHKCKAVGVTERSLSALKFTALDDHAYIAKDVEDQRQPRTSNMILPLETNGAEALDEMSLPREGSREATMYDVRKLLDKLVARQEMFFTDLLESMEKKFAVRDRLREEKEEQWRAEERAQHSVFNNAMLVLTETILGEGGSGTRQGIERARSDVADR